MYLASIRFPVLQFGFEPGEFNSEHTFIHFYSLLLPQPADNLSPEPEKQFEKSFTKNSTKNHFCHYRLHQSGLLK